MDHVWFLLEEFLKELTSEEDKRYSLTTDA